MDALPAVPNTGGITGRVNATVPKEQVLRGSVGTPQWSCGHEDKAPQFLFSLISILAHYDHKRQVIRLYLKCKPHKALRVRFRGKCQSPSTAVSIPITNLVEWTIAVHGMYESIQF